MREVPPTPLSTLIRARELGLAAVLRFVYCGNVRHPASEVTTCPGCAAPVIARDRYVIAGYRLDEGGRCRACGTVVPGRYGTGAGDFGRLPIPVRIKTGG